MKSFIFYFILLIPKLTTNNHDQAELVIWNVGQGQWVTLRTETECLHLDMGGDKNMTRNVSAFCKNRNNRIWLSHWDYDHMSFVKKYSLHNNSCLESLSGPPPTEFKKRQIEHIPLCSTPTLLVRQIFSDALSHGNAQSQVAYIRLFQVLAPGDSTQKQEIKWANSATVANTKGLILGHHGSRTSTSDYFLSKMSQLRWAIASAKQSKYGHPHREVLNRLKKKKIPVLRTEDWGSIHFH
ncbi:MAG: hypothetical protein BroJett040_03090 [Oligoflexia bacterium]|nr:MAG: hypothetical protein BroJett040_03090 [Oligoflexia bacterium]